MQMLWKSKKLMRAARTLTVVTLLAAFGIGLTGCAATLPVNSPCGVITDSLGDVHATTRAGDKRISDNFERGVRAGCWSRSTAVAPKAPTPTPTTVAKTAASVPVASGKQHWWSNL